MKTITRRIPYTYEAWENIVAHIGEPIDGYLITECGVEFDRGAMTMIVCEMVMVEVKKQ